MGRRGLALGEEDPVALLSDLGINDRGRRIRVELESFLLGRPFDGRIGLSELAFDLLVRGRVPEPVFRYRAMPAHIKGHLRLYRRAFDCVPTR